MSKSLDRFHSGFVLLDCGGRITVQSESGAELLRRIGVQDGDVSLLECEAPSVRDLLERALDSKCAHVAETLGLDGDPYELRAERLKPSRSKSRLTLQIRSLLHERQLEERCLSLERCEGLDRLIPRVVHDARNPLAAASMLVEAVGLTATLDEEHRTKLTAAVQQVDEACGILDSLSKFSREGPPTYQPHCLNDSVNEIADLHRKIIERRGIQLALELDAEVPPVYGDPSQLKHLITNLLMNGADAIEGESRSGTIRIATSSCRGIPRLTVEDDGPGIPADIARRVFTPFFTTKPPGMGTGLGLSICRGVARAHGGHLSLRPREPNGSVFVLDLPDPRSMRPAKDRTFLGVSQSQEPVRHALVVETDPQQIDVAGHALRRQRYTVHVAQNGEEALRKLSATSFDLLLCGYELRDMSAEALMEQALRLDPGIVPKAVFTSTEADGDRFRTWVARLDLPHLRSPYDASALDELLKGLAAISV